MFTSLFRSASSLAVRSLQTAKATPTRAFASLQTLRQSLPKRAMSTDVQPMQQSYSGAMEWLHWGMAAGMITCVATVKGAQWTKDKALKGQLMLVHKSTALLVLGMLVPRLAVRLASKMPAAVPGAKWEHIASNISHFSLYAFMIVMPVSGVAMGYFGGKGLPFFGYHISGAGADDKRPDIAKKAYNIHTKAGVLLEYFVPLHIGAVGFHLARGQNILARMGLGSATSTPTAAAAAAASKTL